MRLRGGVSVAGCRPADAALIQPQPRNLHMLQVWPLKEKKKKINNLSLHGKKLEKKNDLTKPQISMRKK